MFEKDTQIKGEKEKKNKKRKTKRKTIRMKNNNRRSVKFGTIGV